MSLPQEVCHDVCSEPHLQQLSGEVLSSRTSIRVDDARLNISACGFGVVDSNKHFSTSGCSCSCSLIILYPNARANHSRLHIGNMSRSNSSSMVREFGKLRSSFSPLIWELQRSTSVWLPSSVISGVSSTVLP